MLNRRPRLWGQNLCRIEGQQWAPKRRMSAQVQHILPTKMTIHRPVCNMPRLIQGPILVSHRYHKGNLSRVSSLTTHHRHWDQTLHLFRLKKVSPLRPNVLFLPISASSHPHLFSHLRDLIIHRSLTVEPVPFNLIIKFTTRHTRHQRCLQYQRATSRNLCHAIIPTNLTTPPQRQIQSATRQTSHHGLRPPMPYGKDTQTAAPSASLPKQISPSLYTQHTPPHASGPTTFPTLAAGPTHLHPTQPPIRTTCPCLARHLGLASQSQMHQAASYVSTAQAACNLENIGLSALKKRDGGPGSMN